MFDLKDIYKEYGKSVYRFLLSLTGDPILAEELVQETFYQAILHIDQFSGRSSLYTWLCRIGKNAWIKECHRKKRYIESSLDDLVISDVVPSQEEMIIEKELIHQIRKTLLHLDEPYKEVFILHVFGNLKLKDIAALNGKSESWARVTFHRARYMIAKEVIR